MNNGVFEALGSVLGVAAVAVAGMVVTLAIGVVPVALYCAAMAVTSRWRR